MSSWHTHLLYIFITVIIASLTLNLLLKKRKVKRIKPAGIGLGLVVLSIIEFIVRFSHKHLTYITLLILILLFAAGAVIFSIWGISRKSLDAK